MYEDENIEMKIHHIGCCVLDLKRAITQYERMGYTIEWETFDEKQKIEIAFMVKDEYRMELIQPSMKESVIYKFTHGGTGPYHTCYIVNQYDIIKDKLRKEHWVPVSDEMVGFCNKKARYSFYYNRNIGMIEIVEDWRKYDK